MFFFRSLRAKTVATALIPTAVVFVAVAIIALYAYDQVSRDAERVVQGRDSELARITAARLSEALSQHSRVLQSTAADDDVQSLEPARLSAALERSESQLRAFDAGVVVYDSEGVALWPPGEPQGADFLAPSVFETVQRVQRTLRPVFSNVYLDPRFGEDLILMAVPIVGSANEFEGVLVGLSTLRYSPLGETYSQVMELTAGREGFAYLVDGDGRVIYHRDTSQLGADFTGMAPVMRALRNETGALFMEDSEGRKLISGFAPVPGTDWGLITQERWENVAGPVRDYGTLLLVLLAVGGGASGVLIFFAVGRILKPVKDLTHGAQRIAGGDFDHTISAKTGDEIQGLAEQFNTMAGALKDSYADLERKVAERTSELRQAEEKYRSIYEHAVEGIFQTTPEGRFLAANPVLANVCGYESPQEMMASVNDIQRQLYVEPGRRAEFIRLMEEHGAVSGFQFQAYRKDGSVMWISENARAVRDEGGAVRYYEGYVQDITEHRRAEEALADMASFAEMNPAPVLKLDRHGTILLVNPAARELLGEPDLLGKSWYALCPELEPMALERVIQGHDALWHEAQVGERCILFTYRASLDSGQVYGFGADITERRGAEEALRESETMLRQSEKMAVLGTLTAGVAHELNNPAAAVKSGAGQLEAAIAQFGQAQSELSRLALAAAQQEALQRLIHQARAQATSPLELNALARSDRERELETWLEERGLSNARELAPTLANLNYDTAGLATLADEFAPDQLSAVIGGLVATHVVHSVVTEVGQSAGRIAEIVKALKSYSYLDKTPVQAVDVHEGLDNTLLVLAHKLKSGIGVRKEYAPHLPKIQANGSELNQVWTNIIDNAADALEGQGELTIRTRQDGQRVVIEIEDDGPGIPAEIQSRIFEPFFTTKPPGLGTGLGLDISYNIVVHKHRGEIKVLSQPGRTCFQVRLPVNSEAEVTLGERGE